MTIRKHKDWMNRHTWVEAEAQCGDGWAPLLDKLFTDMEKELAGDEEVQPDDLDVKSIETWKGTLRVKVEPMLPEFKGLLEQARLASLWTCESCGEDGTMRRGKNLVRCRSCAQEQELILEKEELN